MKISKGMKLSCPRPSGPYTVTIKEVNTEDVKFDIDGYGEDWHLARRVFELLIRTATPIAEQE